MTWTYGPLDHVLLIAFPLLCIHTMCLLVGVLRCVCYPLHRMRVWPVSSLQMVSFHDWPLHSMRTAGMLSDRAWNLVASGVVLFFNCISLCCKCLFNSQFPCLIYLGFRYVCTPHLLSVVPLSAGMMWTTVWPPLWGLDNVLDVTLRRRAVFPMGGWPIHMSFIFNVLYMCMPQWLSHWYQISLYILVKSHITRLYINSVSSTRCFLTKGICPITNGMCPLREITIWSNQHKYLTLQNQIQFILSHAAYV